MKKIKSLFEDIIVAELVVCRIRNVYPSFDQGNHMVHPLNLN